MADRDEWNKKVIDEFRENAGKVGGMFENIPLLLLHSTGARSGQARINPLAYRPDGDRFVIFGSKAGAPTNPDWYHNLRANPDASIEVGTEAVSVRAREATGDERDRLWSAQKAEFAAFADYEAKTPRQIPVVVLERR